MSAEAHAQLVKLQLNNSGAWKDVVHFDRSNDVRAQHVLHAAATLGNVDTRRVTFRVVTEGALPEVLMAWSKDDGWKPASAHA